MLEAVEGDLVVAERVGVVVAEAVENLQTGNWSGNGNSVEETEAAKIYTFKNIF